MQFVGLTEHRGPVKLHVNGTIPAYAAGALYRTGPGVGELETAERGTYYISHWFDGFAHTHRFDIAAPHTSGGETTVTYSSRRQGEKYIEQVKKRGWRTGITFAQRSDPCVGLYAKAMARFDKSIDNNVVVLRNVPGLTKTATAASGHRSVSTDNIVVTTDATLFQSLDKDSLEVVDTGSQERFHPDLKGPLSMSHAQLDDETGDMFNVNLAFGRSPTYRFFRVNAKTGTTDIIATIAGRDVRPAYIHSFFLTQSYVVLCIPSSHLAWAGAKIAWTGNLLEAMKPFDKSARCQWIVVDRRHGAGVVARFSTPAGFFFHSINAFEETTATEDGVLQTHLNLDYVHYETTAPMFAVYYDVLLNRQGAADKFWAESGVVEAMAPRFARRRFTMPATKQTDAEAAHATAEEVLAIPMPHIGEMPTINRAYACRPYRYVYSAPSRGLSTAISDCIVKTDLHSRDALVWAGPNGHTPGEPIFVARPGATDEDDGVVLSVVLDGEGKRSYLMCLDAKTLTEIGRAEAEFAIPIGLHGLHAPAA